MARARGSARRYADAAFEIAERDGAVEQWRSELELMGEVLATEPVVRVLANPAIPLRDREDVLRRVVGDRVSPGPINLVRLLLQRGRIERLPQVVREFRRLYDRREGITEALVTSAMPLDDAEVAALRERLASTTGGRIDMSMQVDPAILGGVVVRMGDRLLDGSVRGRLERLRGRLAAGTL